MACVVPTLICVCSQRGHGAPPGPGWTVLNTGAHLASCARPPLPGSWVGPALAPRALDGGLRGHSGYQGVRTTRAWSRASSTSPTGGQGHVEGPFVTWCQGSHYSLSFAPGMQASLALGGRSPVAAWVCPQVRVALPSVPSSQAGGGLAAGDRVAQVLSSGRRGGSSRDRDGSSARAPLTAPAAWWRDGPAAPSGAGACSGPVSVSALGWGEGGLMGLHVPPGLQLPPEC